MKKEQKHWARCFRIEHKKTNGFHRISPVPIHLYTLPVIYLIFIKPRNEAFLNF